jgi:hypothetical protein
MGSISENRKLVKLKFGKTEIVPERKGLSRASTESVDSRNATAIAISPAWGRTGPLSSPFSPSPPPVPLVALRARAAALLRNRSIWPLGRVTQISPIHSSLTPVIGLALKLVRLTEVADFPRSIVFR